MDMNGFRRECELIKVLGFDGKSLINPRQIDIVHEVFAPKPAEVDYALQVVEAIVGAREQGTGVVALAGKMIDAPVVARAVRVLMAAKSLGMIETDIDESVIMPDAVSQTLTGNGNQFRSGSGCSSGVSEAMTPTFQPPMSSMAARWLASRPAEEPAPC